MQLHRLRHGRSHVTDRVDRRDERIVDPGLGPDDRAADANVDDDVDDGAAPVLSAEAKSYLDEAIGLMQRWSINRDEVDWAGLEQLARRITDGAETPADTHSAIRSAMHLLHDGHSVFLAPTEADTFAIGPARFDEPVVEVRHDRIGHVSIGRYSGDVGDQADAYAAALAGDVAEAVPATCGWIVDLRTDSGGNMWPMVAGLAPLVGTGHIGSFTSLTGRPSAGRRRPEPRSGTGSR